MGNAGYGNHDAPQGAGRGQDRPGPEGGSGEEASSPAALGVSPQDQATPDPPSDAEAVDRAQFARIKPGRTPPDREISPDRREGNPAVSPQATREVSTPAEGAGPLPTDGDEVDPGAG